MHARVLWIQVEPDAVDEITTIYEQSVFPEVRALPGFRGALLLVDPGRAKGLSITLWDTEDAMDAGESSGFVVQQAAKITSLVTAPPTLEHYEVRVYAQEAG